MDFPNPHSLLEAYHSIYNNPQTNPQPLNENYIEENYIDEDDEYFYEVAEFLLDEGLTEEEIIALTEEEDFLDILDYIEEKMTDAEKKALSRHSRARLGIQSSGQSKTGKPLKGAARERSIASTRQKRAERQAWDDATPRQKEIAQRGRASVERHQMKKLDAEAEKIHQANKQQAASKQTPNTLVGRLKAAAKAGAERDKAARAQAGKIAKGVGEYFKTKHGAKTARAGGKKASDAAIERLARKKAHKAANEEFEYVLEYVMEEGYDYDDALDIIEELDDETIETILMYSEAADDPWGKAFSDMKKSSGKKEDPWKGEFEKAKKKVEQRRKKGDDGSSGFVKSLTRR